MASPKLTTSIRDKIIHNALKNAFAAKKAASATAPTASLPAVVVTGLNEMLAKALNRPLTA